MVPLGKVISLLGDPSVMMMTELFWQPQQVEHCVLLGFVTQAALTSPEELSLKAETWQLTLVLEAFLQALLPNSESYMPVEVKYWPTLKRAEPSGVPPEAGLKKPPVMLAPSTSRLLLSAASAAPSVV